MPAIIKAIVLKTQQLQETKEFLENVLHFSVKESSAQHFVLWSKSIRLVFMESQRGFETEIYANESADEFVEKKQMNFREADFKNYKDPNGIHIIIQ